MKSYQITVGGETFPIQSDADESHIEQLSREIQQRYDAMQPKRTGVRLPPQNFRAMTMVAVVLLDELVELRNSHATMEREAVGFAERIAGRIDAILSENG